MSRIFAFNMMNSESTSCTETQSSCAQGTFFCNRLFRDAMAVASIIIALILIVFLGLAGLLSIGSLLFGVILILESGIVLVGNLLKMVREQGRF